MSEIKTLPGGVCPVCDGATEITEEYYDGERSKREELCRLAGCYYCYTYFWEDREGKVREEHRVALGGGEVTYLEAGVLPKDSEELSDRIATMRNRYAGREPYERAFLEHLRRDSFDRVTRSAYADWLEEKGRDDEAVGVRQFDEDRERAVRWMKNHAIRVQQLYDEMVEAGHSMKAGGGWCFGTDAAQDTLLDESYREQWWRAWEKITAEAVTTELIEQRNFRCAC
jgi:uncharacterized protein (TIGR02996 family)